VSTATAQEARRAAQELAQGAPATAARFETIRAAVAQERRGRVADRRSVARYVARCRRHYGR
jgi:hypothetical protein